MRFNPSLKLRSMMGEHIFIRQSNGQADMTTVVSLNETALKIYESFAGRDFDEAEVVGLLTSLYDVDTPTAERDTRRVLQEMRQQGLLID